MKINYVQSVAANLCHKKGIIKNRIKNDQFQKEIRTNNGIEIKGKNNV